MSGWPMIPLKRVASINERSLPETTEADYRFRYVDVTAVSEGEVSVPNGDTTFAAAPSRARRIADEGDVLVSTVRTYLRSVATVPEGQPLIFSTGLAVLSARSGTDPRFLSYACRSGEFLQQVEARSTGVSYPAISPSELGDVPVPLPPMDEQRRIVDFLDTEVGLLSHMRAMRTAQLELELHSWRSRVSEAVLGAEGRATPLRRLLEHSFAGVWGHDPGTDAFDLPCVRVADFDREHYRVSDAPTIRSISDKERRSKILRAGDVLLEKSGGTDVKPVGCAVMFEGEPGAICSNFIQVLRPSGAYEARYVGYVMAALYETRRNGAFVNQTTGIQNLDLQSYLSSSVAVPVHGRQTLIVQDLDEARSKVRAVRTMLEQSERLLRERQQALITAAVTGQIDVTTARGVA